MAKEMHLSRRERQIMDIIYRRGRATVVEVCGDIPGRLSLNTVRTLLTIMEDKGYLRHTKKSHYFIFHPVRPRKAAGRSAFKRVVGIFFDGSLEKALVAYLADPGAELSAEQLKGLSDLISRAHKEGK